MFGVANEESNEDELTVKLKPLTVPTTFKLLPPVVVSVVADPAWIVTAL